MLPCFSSDASSCLRSADGSKKSGTQTSMPTCSVRWSAIILGFGTGRPKISVRRTIALVRRLRGIARRRWGKVVGTDHGALGLTREKKTLVATCASHD